MGLSIALGSHDPKKDILDLVITQRNTKKQDSDIKKLKSKKSLIRLRAIAREALFWAMSRLIKKEIKKYDISPIHSHLKIKK